MSAILAQLGTSLGKPGDSALWLAGQIRQVIFSNGFSWEKTWSARGSGSKTSWQVTEISMFSKTAKINVRSSSLNFKKLCKWTMTHTVCLLCNAGLPGFAECILACTWVKSDWDGTMYFKWDTHDIEGESTGACFHPQKVWNWVEFYFLRTFHQKL